MQSKSNDKSKHKKSRPGDHFGTSKSLKLSMEASPNPPPIEKRIDFGGSIFWMIFWSGKKSKKMQKRGHEQFPAPHSAARGTHGEG